MATRPNFLRLVMSAAFTLVLSSAFTQAKQDRMTRAQAAYDAKDYATSGKLFLEAYKKEKKGTLALYNAACSFALTGQTNEAFAALGELLRHGYNTPARLNEDADFAGIRGDARWGKVVAKAEDNARKNPPIKPWSPPYKVLGVPASVPMAPSSETEVWLEGDVLTFLHHSSAKSVRLTGGVQEPMQPILGTDLWIFQAQMTGWERAFDSYGFVEDGKFGPQKLWKGAFCPQMPPKADPLQGQIIERTIHSQALNEDRKLMIYLPPGAIKKELPAVFMADGGDCRSFAQVLEPLIVSGKVRPCAIVGVYAGSYQGEAGKPYDMSKDYRALEYLPVADPARFKAHLRFFSQEVGTYVTHEFGISTKREDRAVTGFSNGGAFAAAAAFRAPEFFGTSIPLSLGIPPADPLPASPMPRMFFAGGALEVFGDSTRKLYEKVNAWGVESTFRLYPAGHDLAMWQLAFANYMLQVFPGR